MIAKWLVIFVPVLVVLSRFGLIVRDIWLQRRANAARLEAWRLQFARGLTSERLDEYQARLAGGRGKRGGRQTPLGNGKEGY